MVGHTITVKPATYDHLAKYRAARHSSDEVINDVLDEIDPVEFYEDTMAENHHILAEMEQGDFVTFDELKKKLKAS